MTRTPLIIALGAAAALAGCNKESHTIVAGGPQEDNTANVASNGPVVLPPSITASKTYRCADNSLVYIDWMSDGSARVMKKKGETGTPLPAGSPDLRGDSKASSVSYKGQSCSA